MAFNDAVFPTRELPSRELPNGAFGRREGTATRFRAEPDSREAALLRLEQFAHLMDSAFVIPGINRRVGLDAVVGLVPIIGDAAGMLLASYIVYEARRLGAPRWLLARMAMNVAFDGVIGAVPLAGDIFDAAFKANRRNVRLLRRHLEKTGGLRPNEIEGTAVRLDG
ncbi:MULTISPECIES: DUF4112 domain-containing protein [Methylobacterium]|jgi:hypothetical protein|uniref:DUF4112 domain-containing protein n=1 Tax=Methylobacterium bullatum TaxID=570505 RepID=A0A679JPF3_9HYPH|nr:MULTISPECIES: DUF4112 domain-containing protein [Methylobacterium]TXN19757.1 DUF4112 domain-containing protein [Methylobacterium sp. WL19]GJD37619.1 hypothetical protein OICFNHDK_0056 [Methylobacterium bullatum]CAA2138497.1 hypothetical protein MBLL_01176 [Methylobacterium bullatum]